MIALGQVRLRAFRGLSEVLAAGGGGEGKAAPAEVGEGLGLDAAGDESR